MPYCVEADVYSYGLPRGALRNPGRPADAARAIDDAIALDVHGFALNDQISFRPEAGGRLPMPLVQGVTYFAIPLSEGAFSVAATEDGAAIDLTTDGARIVVIAPLNFTAAIAFGAEIINDQLPAHCVPLVAPYPPIIVMTNAVLAGGKLMNGSASQSLLQIVDEANQRVARWAKGQPLRGTNTAKQVPAQVPQSSDGPPSPPLQMTIGACDPVGWNRFGGL